MTARRRLRSSSVKPVRLLDVMRAERADHRGDRPLGEWIADNREAIAAGIDYYERAGVPDRARRLAALLEVGDE